MRFQQMLESMKTRKDSDLESTNPFRNKISNFGSIYHILDDEKTEKKRGDIHQNFLEQIYKAEPTRKISSLMN